MKAYDDELAQDADADSPLALQHFVIFRLCPTSSCSSCDGDGVMYGKYAVEVDTYLESMVEYQKQAFETTCNTCDRTCNKNDDGDSDQAQTSAYCTSCSEQCNFYSNLEANGYVDASAYTQCQQLAVANNGEDEGAAAEEEDDDTLLYIGPRCNAKGKIIIGLFSDEKCHEPVDGQNIETLLGAKLSYHMLNNTYTDEGACVSCKEVDDGDENAQDEAQQGDDLDADNVNEMCENLYNSAAKCESKTGITVGFIQTNRENEEGKQENQVQNEFLACTFIDSLIWNSYTETGEINIGAKQDVIIRQVTRRQAVALSLVSLSMFALVGLAFYTDRVIKKIELANPKVFRQEHTWT